MIEAERYWRDM